MPEIRETSSRHKRRHPGRGFARERLAPYKVPKQIILVDALPRNAMGKVTKPTVVELFDLRDVD